jgi:hypothetical protein
MDTAIDEAAEPFFGQEVIDVGLAEAGGDSGEQLVFKAVIEAAERAGKNVGFSAAFVADDFGAFDADEGGGVSELAQAACGFSGDELAVGKNLEEAIRVFGEKIEKVGMHEWFSAEEAEEAVAVGLGIIDEPIEFFEFDFGLGLVDVDPTSLAAEVAAIEHGDVKEGGEVDAVFEAFFEALDGAHALVTEVPCHLHEMAMVGGGEDAAGELKNHERARDRELVRRINARGAL